MVTEWMTSHQWRDFIIIDLGGNAAHGPAEFPLMYDFINTECRG